MLALAAKKNLSAAAAACFISQSALSQSLAKLEHLLGLRLFERGINTWTPTEAGQRYLEAAGKIVEIHNQLLLDLGVTGKKEGQRIRLGMSLERSSKIFPQIYLRLKNEFPDNDLQLVEEHAYTLQRMVMRGELDMAICVVPAADQKEERLQLRYETAVAEGLVLITALSHPFALRYAEDPAWRPTAAELSDERFIQHSKQKALHYLLEAMMNERGIRPMEQFEVSSTTAVVEFVGKGSGISIVPKLFALGDANVRIIPMEEPLTWELGVISRQSRPVSRLERRLSAIIREELLRLLHETPETERG